MTLHAELQSLRPLAEHLAWLLRDLSESEPGPADFHRVADEIEAAAKRLRALASLAASREVA